MTDEEKIRKAFADATPKPLPVGRRPGPLNLTPATVTLTEEQIKWAIDTYVSAEGYAVGKVTLVSQTDRQRNGPDTFTAVVEVTPKGERPDSCYDRETPR